MPMYHYEPRRWSGLENGDKPGSSAYDKAGNWDEPFGDIATVEQPGTFVGFKMYTALGYKPFDGRLKHTLEKFYGECQSKGIPVLCHCSPGGMYTHDRRFYFDREFYSYQNRYGKDKRGAVFWRTRREYDKKRGFYDSFGRPSAWEEQVLSRFPKLKLCLAHFGGGSSEWSEWKEDTLRKIHHRNERRKYLGEMVGNKDEEKLIADWYFHDRPEEGIPNPRRWIREIVEMMERYDNFYTDISFHFVENHKKQLTWLIKEFPHITERIMFGTDWYMTELDNWSITKFVRRTKRALDGISRELETATGVRDDLWLRFSRINPMKFYGIRGIADNFAVGLEHAEDVLNKQNKDKKEKDKKYIELDQKTFQENWEIIQKSDLL